MVSDDSKSVGKLYEKIIQMVVTPPYRVQIVKNGDALETFVRCVAAPPELLITDRNKVTKPNGFELCCALRNDTRTADLPILMISGTPRRVLRREAFEAEADAFLSKPCHVRPFLAAMRNALRRKGLSDRIRLHAS